MLLPFQLLNILLEVVAFLGPQKSKKPSKPSTNHGEKQENPTKSYFCCESTFKYFVGI